MGTNYIRKITFNEKEVNSNTGKETNSKALWKHLLLFGKYELYTTRFNNAKPNFKVFIEKVKNIIDLEKRIAYQNEQYNQFNDKWGHALMHFQMPLKRTNTE